MAYSAALPYERPTKLRAWEIPIAVAGALVDCLTCGFSCRGEPPASEEAYWPAAVPPQPLPTYNSGRGLLSGDNFETKAVFTNIPLREEAIRQGFIQPAEGESPYTTLYSPPLGPAVRLVPIEAAAAAAGIPIQTSLQQRFPGDPASVADAAMQADVDAARTAEAAQQAFVTTGAAAAPAVTVMPSYFGGTLQPAATAAAVHEVLRSPYETVRVTTVEQQGAGPLGQQMLQREEEAAAAYQRSFVPPVIPRTYEVYLPSGSWTPAATEHRRYVFAPRAPTVSQAVQTVFEEEERGDTSMEKKGSALVSGGNEAASSEKDTSHTDQTLSEGGSADNAVGGRKGKITGKRRERKEHADEKEGSCEAVEEEEKEEEGEGGGGGGEEGNSGDQQKTTPAGASGGEQSSVKMTLLSVEERTTTDTSVSDKFVFKRTQVENAPAANRCLVGFVPPVPPQEYKQIYVGGRPYLQGGVFYLSDTGAYLLGI